MKQGAGSDAIEIEQRFREANDAILGVAEELRVNIPVPFLCECGDPRCRQLIRIPWSEFEAVHDHRNRFMVVPGHELLETEDVVVETDRYTIVEK